MRLGMTWARVLFNIFALQAIALLTYTLTDEVPTMLKILGGVNAAAALVAIVLVWLGPSNAFNRARKAYNKARKQFSPA